MVFLWILAQFYLITLPAREFIGPPAARVKLRVTISARTIATMESIAAGLYIGLFSEPNLQLKERLRGTPA